MGLKRAGYTLIELVVAMGLFAIVMTLATGAYLIMINADRNSQALATGMDNLTFALDTMTTTIRTGGDYCGSGDCGSLVNATQPGSAFAEFSLRDQNGNYVTYGLASGAIVVCENPATWCSPAAGSSLTDPEVQVTSLSFSPWGTQTLSASGDQYAPYVTITANGIVSTGPGKSQAFSVETSAVMRGTDL